MSLSKLKRNRVSITDMVQAASKDSEKKNYNDDRIWKPTVDKAGNGYSVIRFLPAHENNELPWVQYWDHGFKGPTGQWYIEKSRTTLGEKDPVSEMNSKLWNSGIESDKEIVRERKRRLHYVSNIYVESDPKNPQNEGKVFLFVYGKKIFDKIMDVMQPQFEDEKPMNPFDFWEGASFKLKIRKVEGYRNYDKSEFDSTEEFLGGDESELEQVYESVHDLSEFTDPDNYKSYDELAERLALVLGEDRPTTVRQETDLSETREPVEPRSKAPVQTAEESGGDDEEDTLSYFANLANAD